MIPVACGRRPLGWLTAGLGAVIVVGHVVQVLIEPGIAFHVVAALVGLAMVLIGARVLRGGS